MKRSSYDIFISYRRDSGAQYARSLQLMLEKKGFRVFLDYDELVDQKFSPQIEAAIRNSTVYIILLSRGSMARCANDGDWVRREIEIALDAGKQIIPVNPDGTFDGIPADVPAPIRSAIEERQYSEISFGQTLNATVDLMVRNRIRPYVRRKKPLWATLGLTILAIVLVVVAVLFWRHKVEEAEIEALKGEITFDGANIEWPDDISKAKLLVVKEILEEMRPIAGGTFSQGARPLPDGSYDGKVEPEYETPAREATVKPFHIQKFEVTTGQWNALMDDRREGDPSLPVASVDFSQASAMAERLFEITGLSFRLPSEAEWEYAARGGARPEGFMYAGSDDPKEVAWYAANSGGHSHSDLTSSTGTIDDLYNMSGNVSEWTATPFRPYNPEVPILDETAMTVRGGNYDSEVYELTVSHREPALPSTSIPTLGFRLAIGD